MVEVWSLDFGGMGFWVLGFRVLGFEFRAQDSGFDLGFGI